MSPLGNYVAIAILIVALVLNILAIAEKRRARPFVAVPLAADVIPKNSVFHKPLNANCPIGTTLMPAYFKQKDGSMLDACHNPNGDGSIDYLNPGESMSLSIGPSARINFGPADETRVNL